ncbi:MAG: bifunctional phosphoribosyl-AMP cyclohydrolase/phosphoribosyl-ATP diphosphatase HisIE [Parvularculaceae bacterium]
MITLADVDFLDWEKSDGLLPAIIQDERTLQVLMLGYMNPAALRATLETGWTTFYSRTRKSLWQKGETSGNRLRLKSVRRDCDNDALLVSVAPEGPTCHLGSTSCFSGQDAPGLGWLARLEDVILGRKGKDGSRSYTAGLFAEGPARIAKKVGEEGVETALAGASGELNELNEEAADLLFHLLLLLAARNSSLAQVVNVLRARRGG